jgi:hypothetical protein
MSRKSVSACAFAAISLAGFGGVESARADSVWIGTEKSTPIETSGVKIVSVDGDKLSYTLESGTAKDVPMSPPANGEALSYVHQISVDGETSFNAAEQAYADRKADAALSGYQAALSSSKDWIKARSALRLIGLAKSRDRFDLQEAAFVQLVKYDPADAALNRPSKPSATTPGIDTALSTINTGLGISTLSATQKSSLLQQALEIYRAKGDTANVTATLTKLGDLGANSPSDQALLKVSEAAVACDAKQYDKAIATIQQNKALFNEPDIQVDALFVLAQAEDGRAGKDASADKQKEIALDYMRAATFGGNGTLPDKPHVAESLFRAAQLEEALNDPKAALALYQQIGADNVLAKSPVAAAAKAAADRLK